MVVCHFKINAFLTEFLISFAKLQPVVIFPNLLNTHFIFSGAEVKNFILDLSFSYTHHLLYQQIFESIFKIYWNLCFTTSIASRWSNIISRPDDAMATQSVLCFCTCPSTVYSQKKAARVIIVEYKSNHMCFLCPKFSTGFPFHSE